MELKAPFMYKGVRLYVTEQNFDIDGTLLYCLGGKEKYRKLQMLSEHFDLPNVPEKNLKRVRLTIWQWLDRLLFKEFHQAHEEFRQSTIAHNITHGDATPIGDLPPRGSGV